MTASAGFKIRPVQEQDAERISEINLVCWQTAYRGLIADEVLDTMTQTPARLKRFKEGIREFPVYLCAEKEGVIMGYICGGSVEEGMPCSLEARCLYVHPDFQGQGVGGKLLTAFKSAIGNKTFCVYMLDGNDRALAFYQKQGGVRQPQYDMDVVIRKLKTHDLCLVFENYK